MSEQGWFVKTASFVGDLSSPFYDEERERDVWNEASAVGLQAAIWLGLIASIVAIWVGGAAALPYVVVFFGVITVSAIVSTAYAKAHGVDPGRDMRARTRMMVFFALYLLLLVGIARAVVMNGLFDALPDSFAHGFAVGLVAGGAAVIAWTVWRVVRLRRRARRD